LSRQHNNIFVTRVV